MVTLRLFVATALGVVMGPFRKTGLRRRASQASAGCHWYCRPVDLFAHLGNAHGEPAFGGVQDAQDGVGDLRPMPSPFATVMIMAWCRCVR